MPVQKLLDTDELKTKVQPITLAFVVGLVIMGFFLGVNFTRIQASDEIQSLQHQFAIDEIGGLRADVVRENAHLQKQIDELKKKLEELNNK